MIWTILKFTVTFIVNMVLILPVTAILYSCFATPEMNDYAGRVSSFLGLPVTANNIFLVLLAALLFTTCVGWVLIQRCVIGKYLNCFLMKAYPLSEEEAMLLDKALMVLEKKGGIPKDRYNYYAIHIPTWNAVSFGKREIAVTALLLRDFSPEETAGVIAHEIGHHENGHINVNNAINGLWFLSGLCEKLLDLTFHVLIFLRFIPFVGFVSVILSWVIWIFLAVFNWLIRTPAYFIDLFFERRNEFTADAYAVKIGLGQGLIDSFHRIAQIEGNVPWWEVPNSNHPRTASRIRALEKLMEKKAREKELGYKPIFGAQNMKAVNAAAFINTMSNNRE